ncbi:ATP-dependent RNA helicase HrpA [Actinorugispora endophytica]|uniref:RNA helicase n=1 Tax=Actinorugispora endophytica TaxID=1605990 RepID=A0A4R6UG71_9ACTN|nr:ATP-dependent RNA helicase HrpA [Actinorugispora endophytica]TDQ43905.1 ATP-dependent helicase HrpA [Actinorugispora endophytica]
MKKPPVKSPLADLRRRLPELMPRDRHRLRRRIDGAGGISDPEKQRSAIAAITADVDAAEARVERRRAAFPEVRYPSELPVSQKKDDILAAVRDHQVVIVAGETGSGKTTQLPKICLELGRGVLGQIGHTQPRRLAARTVAERIAQELRTPLGEAVGYKVRFTDESGDNTLVKLMTDGILLAEIQRDRMLRGYDTLIIDEAHERSLNIDFILGYLKQLLPRRPDLKVIITSATIDPERFSRHFDDAPIVEVSGRTYPVEVRYRPLAAEDVLEDGEDDDAVTDDRDQVQGICDAVDELCAEGPGDILVFLSGEREIRDTAEALEKHLGRRFPEHSPHAVDVLPLYARLSSAEQHRVFQPHTRRRVVLATNVAETSLTVPGIRYVVDPGTARISRYSHRTKVQRLPIERVSQASANQRKGRCGRVAEGVCVRLYSEEDFESRPEFTEPEILRTNLASVILQMSSLGLGDIAAFPFVEGPDHRQIKDGVSLLNELGALEEARDDQRNRLTPLGRKLAQLPVDPRLGRMVLEAEKNGCVHEVMVIAAALSIQDPRERPVDRQQAAAEKHARFAEKESDFLSYLNLWSYLREQQRERSGNQFRKMCKNEFLNYLRVREWQDIYSQLKQIARTLGVTPGTTPADPRLVHVSLLSGLLSHIGLKDPEKHEYVGARGARFGIFPGSALFKKQPRWVMSAELVETSRLWARVNARIEPEWAEDLAGHLVKRTYSEPHWEKNQGAVMAYEKVTLYGVPIVAQRKVNYGRVDPPVARELFIRHALVQGEWTTHHAFYRANQKLLEEVEDLEHRARRRGILVDDEVLFDFYDQRVGADVVSTRHFDTWWKRTRREQPDLLDFDRAMLVNASAGDITEEDYPDFWSQGEHRFPLTYQFEPGDEADGVTVHIPLKVLNQVEEDGFDWQIPGLREELVTALLRSLPKPIRRSFVPVPDHARSVLKRLTPGSEPLVQALSRELTAMGGTRVSAEDWQLDRVPDHLRITFRAVDAKGRRLAEAKDLEELRRHLQPRLRKAISAEAAGIERTGLTSWDFGELQRTFERRAAGHVVKGYPALVDEGGSVGVRIFDNEAAQRHAMVEGTRRLLVLNVPSPAKFIQGHLSNQGRLVLSNSPHGSVAALFDDCVACGVDSLVAEFGGPVWDADSFAKLREHVRVGLVERVMAVVGTVERILAAANRLEKRLKGTTSLAVLPSLADIQAQLGGLVRPGFVTATGYRRLGDLPRYLKAVDQRLTKLPENPRRDQVNMAKIEQMRQAYQRLLDGLAPGVPPGPEHEEVRWMLEELRVSYFAQEVGTAYSVSEKRVLKAIDQVRAG